MKDPIAAAAAMAYHTFQTHQPGALPLSAFLGAAQPSCFPELAFPDVASLSQPLSEQAVPDAGLRAALGRPHPPAPPQSFTSLQTEEGLDDDPKVTLDSKKLWTEFHKMGTEMVITKSGRYANCDVHIGSVITAVCVEIAYFYYLIQYDYSNYYIIINIIIIINMGPVFISLVCS